MNLKKKQKRKQNKTETMQCDALELLIRNRSNLEERRKKQNKKRDKKNYHQIIYNVYLWKALSLARQSAIQ